MWTSVKNYVKSWVFCSKTLVKLAKPNDEEINPGAVFLNNIPGRMDRYDIFVNNIRNKIGILILYQTKDVQYLDHFFSNIRTTDYLMDVLRENYVLFSLDVNSPDGRRVISLLNDQVLTPSFLFVLNTNQRNLNQNSMLNKLEGEISDHTFQDSLIHNIEIAQTKRNNLCKVFS